MLSIANWDLSGNQAENYEEYFVPAMFAQWATQVASLAQIDLGHTVLDVGCGTGVLARVAAAEAGEQGRVTGLDKLESMLEVARKQAPHIDWRQGKAEKLPFGDAAFDRVVSQFALMFIKSRVTAVKEMWRVLKPGGRLTLAVWAPLESSAGYSTLLELTRKFASPKAAEVLSRPYDLGNDETLSSVIRAAGLRDFNLQLRKGTAKFPSIEALLEMEIKGTPVFEEMNDHQFGTISAIAHRELEPYRISTGEIVLQLDAKIVIAQKD